MCSIWNRSPGTRKPSGKHPLDGERFLNKNKEQRTRVERDPGLITGSKALKVQGSKGVSRVERVHGLLVRFIDPEV